MGIVAWIEIYLGTRFVLSAGKWVGVIVYIVLFVPNYYFLIVRGHGIRFEREFSTLEKPRKNLLLASCAVTALATIAFMILSVYFYHQFFHIISKRGF